MKSRLTHLIAAIATCAALLLPGAASALTLSPPTFDVAADPGTTLHEAIKVRNESGIAETFTLSTANFTGIPGDETVGRPELYPADEERTGRELAPWISVGKGSITLLPGEEQDIPFTLAIPKDADPGSHFGAVVFSTSGANLVGGVGEVGNAAVLVLLKISGDVVERLDLTSFTAGAALTTNLPVTFQARVENHGTVHERPYGEVTIRNLLGRTVAVLPMNHAQYASVLPDSARRYETAWTGRRAPPGASALRRQWDGFALGPYTAELTLRYGGQGTTLTARTRVWVVPWLPLLLLLSGLTLAIWLIRLLVTRYERYIIRKYERLKHE